MEWGRGFKAQFCGHGATRATESTITRHEMLKNGLFFRTRLKTEILTVGSMDLLCVSKTGMYVHF